MDRTRHDGLMELVKSIAGPEPEWAYSDSQADWIAGELAIPEEEQALQLAVIMLVVDKARRHLATPASIAPLSRGERRTKRRLAKAIDDLAAYLKARRKDPVHALAHGALDKVLPLVRVAVESGLRKPGGQPRPDNAIRYELVEALAHLWLEWRGEPPSRSWNPIEERDVHPFREFVTRCSEPAGVTITDSVLRTGLAKSRKRRKAGR